jgi:hypothetical protein
MKYGVILGKHLDISRAELFAQGINIDKHYWQVALFSDDKNLDYQRLAGIVKWGKVIESKSIVACDLLGVSDRGLGSFLKKQWLCKRYKDFDPMHTDEEIKKEGREYIMLDKEYEKVLEITGYQDITRFSCIDFDKPINSMQIGMMPAKLTQIMLNIAIGKLWTSSEIEWSPRTIFDPFMWLGTTYMVANSLWHNVIWSDINITPAKQNLGRWQKQQYAKQLPITLFTHDVTQSINKPFLQHVNCIVTEWRLWHIVTSKTKPHEIAEYAWEIEKLYKARINNMLPIWTHMTIVCSIPWHTSGDNKHVTNILQHCESKWMRVETVPQVYTRSGQKVGRKIVTLKW